MSIYLYINLKREKQLKRPIKRLKGKQIRGRMPPGASQVDGYLVLKALSKQKRVFTFSGQSAVISDFSVSRCWVDGKRLVVSANIWKVDDRG